MSMCPSFFLYMCLLFLSSLLSSPLSYFLRSKNFQSCPCHLTAIRDSGTGIRACWQSAPSAWPLALCSGQDRGSDENHSHHGSVHTTDPGKEITQCGRWLNLDSCVSFSAACVFDPLGSWKLKFLRSFSPLVILLDKPFAWNGACACTCFISLASNKCFEIG